MSVTPKSFNVCSLLKFCRWIDVWSHFKAINRSSVPRQLADQIYWKNRQRNKCMKQFRRFWQKRLAANLCQASREGAGKFWYVRGESSELCLFGGKSLYCSQKGTLHQQLQSTSCYFNREMSIQHRKLREDSVKMGVSCKALPRHSFSRSSSMQTSQIVAVKKARQNSFIFPHLYALPQSPIVDFRGQLSPINGVNLTWIHQRMSRQQRMSCTENTKVGVTGNVYPR